MRLDPISSKIISELKKVENARKGDKNDIKVSHKHDSSIFSSKAQRLSETSANIDIVASQLANEPEIRIEKVEEVREKIKKGFYNSPEFIDKLAEKLLSDFGI